MAEAAEKLSVPETLPKGTQLLNHEEPLENLVSSFLTIDKPFNRNHSEIVYLDAATHHVRVDGLVARQLSLLIADLRDKYEQHEVTCALQCSGNRRDTMRRRWKAVHGLSWMDGAVMNCRWRGPLLRDVLLKAGVAGFSHDQPTSSAADGTLHVAFACYQALCEDDSYYGGSIDLRRAMAAENEVILALEMNGAQLTPEHGFPVRVVVPGIAGARWVKWLDRITVQAMESPNFYQQHDYKVLPPEVSTWEAAEPYWPLVPAFQAMPVNSIIGMPSSGSVARVSADGVLTVRGVAVPEGDHGPVARVEVSLDDGQTWTDASLHHADETKKWAWVLWSAEVAVPAEARGTKIDILSRATDRGGNTQPRASPWNIRGIGYNGYGEANGVQLE